jgi:deoxyribodipyrimidine photo-lyase
MRRDLRIHDHLPLAAATEHSDAVAVVFVFDTQILGGLKNRTDRRLTYIHRSITELDMKLRERGSKLIVRHGDPVDEIPILARELGVHAVYTARDYEPYARSRDRKVTERLNVDNVEFITLKDTVVMEGGEVLSQDGNPLRVYTPYRSAWLKSFVRERDSAEHLANLDRLWPVAELPTSLTNPVPDLESIGFQKSDLCLEPGEDSARAQLERFANLIDRYGADRDFPALHGTSQMSVHLRFGTVSVREMVRLALESDSEGASKWLNEIIWRDFYQDILFNWPDVIERPFQAVYEKLEYPGEPEHFEAWCEGRTGYPLVDAAMRCFNATGWMHNRLRMVVASFLTKDLLIDYRKGEAYFAEGLLDFDLASNNGGWQWAASVGADPQPYFRIFNPILQSEKFDPEGRFIKQWCPELEAIEGPGLHFPSRMSEFDLLSAGVTLGETYPRPIVDHSVQRQRAIELLANQKGGKSD